MAEENMLRKKLFLDRKNAYDRLGKDKVRLAMNFAEDYKSFLNNCRTERDCCEYLSEDAEKNHFMRYKDGMKLNAGDRVYMVNKNKAIMFAIIGQRPASDGISILAAHIDSPRLDLKQVPVYEDSDICLLKTHYYGGIKRYQWTAVPLEMRGVIIKKDGERVNVLIGRDITDPVFTVSDLLPHLARQQMKKTLSEGVQGENLNVLAGSFPSYEDKEGSDRVKLTVLQLLNEKYGITEEDFISAEISLVPAWDARDVGIDRSMIGAYGHDDHVCAYTAYRAMLEIDKPEFTSVCILADKEEIGSEGISGMQSHAFELFIKNICSLGECPIEKCFGRSMCLSADVTNAFDPTYPDVSEKANSAFLGKGLAIAKYTGSGGKYDTSDASAELMWKLRSILDSAEVSWQTGELGKIDEGGGGTVAMYLADRNINVIDAGVPVLSMHSPFEVVSKLDVYEAYRGYLAFLRRKDGLDD